jgi:multicomponent Na+:H+ antiporter subunit A
VLLLFLCWELTSLISFFLVGFKYSDEQARASARTALFITLGGGLALLAGLILLSEIAGTWSLQEIVAAGPVMVDDPRLPLALTLLFIGCFTKSAQFPFHFWLPNAMTAPTPASAYLHSATMVKLGIYLLARLDPAFDELPLWENTLIAIGTITAIWAALLALRERDLKRILARSTVSALGTLVLLIGLPGESAALAVIAFLYAHALYKAPLFFVAGSIDHATGTRNIDHLRGLRRQMPFTATAALIAGLSMAGLPLSFGYIAKGVVSAAKSETDLLAVVSYGLLLVNAIAVAVAAVAAIRVFWGAANPAFNNVKEVSWRMVLPPLLIAVIALEFEFIPTFVDPVLIDAARAIVDLKDFGYLFKKYPGDIMLSAAEITLITGILLYIFWEKLHCFLERFTQLQHYGCAAIFDRSLKGLTRLAAWHTRALQHGRLDGYMRMTLAAVGLITAGAWFAAGTDLTFIYDGVSGGHEHAWTLGAASIMILAGALAAPFLYNRMALLMAIGLVGYGSAILFLFSGAPDVAFTQFMVETVLVVIAAAVLSLYGKASRYREPRLRNVTIALAAGAGTFLLLMQMFSLPADPVLPAWFAENSLSEANGQNIVNVILVDFRALDTFGEIAVVAFSALAAWPLLFRIRQRRRKE